MRLRLPAPLLFCALALQAGCVMLPIPTQEHKVLAGKPVSEEPTILHAPLPSR